MKLKKLDTEQIDKVYDFLSTLKEENGFGNPLYGCPREGFEKQLEKLLRQARGEDLPEGYVPCTVYLLWNEEDLPVGCFHFRQHLCPFLRTRSGHIGYSIREGYRGRGYATEGLRLMIEEAKRTVPEPELLIGANKSNAASLAVQRRNGALPFLETEDYLLNRIPLERTRVPVVKSEEDPFFDTEALYDGMIRLKAERLSPADPEKGWLPAYHFGILLPDGTRAGECDLRLGHNENTYYGGNIGYSVEEPFRGHRYAARACALLFRLARRHGMDFVIITCRPDNLPSARTCELAGGRLIETVALPEYNDMYLEGMRSVRVCQFMLDEA